MAAGGNPPAPPVWRSERALWVGAATALVFWTVGAGWLGNLESPLVAAGLFLWLFLTMLWLSFGVVRHAEALAVRLGEPMGTIILTLAVIAIEVVMISAVMLTGKENPTLARDTMFSVIMIILNGVLGLTLLLGGLRHREQEYNLSGARSYLVVLIALGTLCLALPRFTTSAPGGEPSKLMAVFLIVVSALLYGLFLFLQSTHHRHHYREPDGTEAGHGDYAVRSTGFHALFLILTMLPIVLLSKKIAVVIDFGIASLGAPYALAGFMVAVLVLSPEGLAAVKAATANQLQRTVNISFGSALATIGLTVPAVLAISDLTGKRIEMGLEPPELVLMALTFLAAAINFGGQRTNVLGGAVHLVIFLAYVTLIFDR